MATLASLVQALPQELYDEIYNLTFAPIRMEGEPCFTKNINEYHIYSDYKPPSVLQVNRYWRKVLTESYYGEDSFFFVDIELAHKWESSLSEDHYRRVRKRRGLLMQGHRCPSLPVETSKVEKGEENSMWSELEDAWAEIEGSLQVGSG